MGIGYELRRGGLRRLSLVRGGWRRHLVYGSKMSFLRCEKMGETYMHSVGVGARVYHVDGLVVEKTLTVHFQRSAT